MAQSQRETDDTSKLNTEETAAGAEATGDLFGYEAAQTVGAKLKAVRDAKGVTHAEVFEGTKIKAAMLSAIESSDHAALPAVPFTAGFIKAYAQFLGLDPEEYARDWRAEAVRPETQTPPVPARQSIKWRAIFPAVRPAVDATEILGDLNVSPDESAASPTPAAAIPNRVATWFGAGAALIFALYVAATALTPRLPSRADQAPAAEGPVPTSAAAVEQAPKIVEAAILPAAVTEIASDRVTTKSETMVAAPRREAKISKVEPSPPPRAAAPAPVATELSAVSADSVNIDEPAPPPTAGDPASISKPSGALASGDLSIGEPLVVAPATIVAATLSRSTAPVYPEHCASSAERTENVAVIFDISAEGRPSSVRLDHASNDCFAEAAIDTAGRMRFSPRTIDGEPSIETGKRVTVRFVR